MKSCPECDMLHSKRGKFCSQSCASKYWHASLSIDERKSWLEKVENSSAYTTFTENLTQRRTRLFELDWLSMITESGVTSPLVKQRLLNEQDRVCLICGIFDWNGNSLTLHLDHIDGNHSNWSRGNLRMICPNCHSQTSTYGGRNKRKNSAL